MITIIFGKDFLKKNSLKNSEIYNTIKKYVHPIGYKLMSWSKDHSPNTNNTKLAKNRIVEDFMIVASAETIECFDLARTSKSFQTKKVTT